MRAANPNLPLLESVVATLGPLCTRFVFVGGCVTGLLITEAATPPVRTTRDVDVIVEVVSLGEYHTLERQLEQAGLRHDRSQDAPVCRWLAGSALLDVMPTNRAVLGFGNRWYDEAVRTAVTHTLPSGTSIRLITAPVFIATKLEAFADRGGGDFLASHDLEDIRSPCRRSTTVCGKAHSIHHIGLPSEPSGDSHGSIETPYPLVLPSSTSTTIPLRNSSR